MNTTSTSGNDPQKYGYSRWAAVKKYACKHEGCVLPATILNTTDVAHNCCNNHEEGAVR